MLKSLKIHNFQIWKRLEVIFSPGITTIIGPTDGGKSSIIRILRWVIFNLPSGSEFISHGEDSCSGKLKVDGKMIVRRKSKSTNLYKLGDKEFKAFGTSVPEEIEAFLNISELNFQFQLSPIFWFMETANFVSKQLNSIVNLGIIDDSQADVASRLRTSKSKLEVSESRLMEARQELQELAWVPVMSEELDELDLKKQAIDKEAFRTQSLTTMLTDLKNLTKFVGSASKRLQSAEELVREGDKLEVMNREVNGISSVLSSLQKIKDRKCQLDKEITSLEKKLRTEVPICGVCLRPLELPKEKKES